MWLGDPEAGPAAGAPLYASARPAASLQRVMSYAELQSLGDHGEPHGNRCFTKSCYLSDLSAGPVEGLVEAVTDIRSPLSSIDFEFLRGAICEVPDEDSAFPRRDEPEGKVLEVYGDARYRRLAAVKDRYDPTNVLSRNQNIQPPFVSRRGVPRQRTM